MTDQWYDAQSHDTDPISYLVTRTCPACQTVSAWRCTELEGAADYEPISCPNCHASLGKVRSDLSLPDLFRVMTPGGEPR